ncbi:MAG: T9SS type A sorting domain-containing protein, partial [Bacteroidia bacterium]|nr:T9SS type A sorting domain-containing protein [Bacteroidia bacterium]
AAVNQVFQAGQNGSYAVIVTQDGCTDTSVCVTINTVGLDEAAATLELQAYPNPTDGMLNISSSVQGTAYVHIFDMSGKMLQTVFMPDAAAMKLDMSALLPGVYLLRVEAGGYTSLIRIIRN